METLEDNQLRVTETISEIEPLGSLIEHDHATKTMQVKLQFPEVLEQAFTPEGWNKFQHFCQMDADLFLQKIRLASARHRSTEVQCTEEDVVAAHPQHVSDLQEILVKEKLTQSFAICLFGASIGYFYDHPRIAGALLGASCSLMFYLLHKSR